MKKPAMTINYWERDAYFYINGERIKVVTYEEVGSSGVSEAETLFECVADALGVEVSYEELDPENG